MLYHTELGRGKPEEGEGVNGGTAGITVEIQTFVPQSRFAHRTPRGLIRRPVVPRSLNPHPPFPPPAPAPLGFLRLVLTFNAATTFGSASVVVSPSALPSAMLR